MVGNALGLDHAHEGECVRNRVAGGFVRLRSVATPRSPVRTPGPDPGCSNPKGSPARAAGGGWWCCHDRGSGGDSADPDAPRTVARSGRGGAEPGPAVGRAVDAVAFRGARLTSLRPGGSRSPAGGCARHDASHLGLCGLGRYAPRVSRGTGGRGRGRSGNFPGLSCLSSASSAAALAVALLSEGGSVCS